jgi:hypothetical protein
MDTVQEQAKGKHTTIEVNGRDKTVSGKEVSYEELVALAFDPVPTGPMVVITITFSGGPAHHREGTLGPGQSTEIKAGERFNVVATDKS